MNEIKENVLRRGQCVVALWFFRVFVFYARQKKPKHVIRDWSERNEQKIKANQDL